MTDPQAAALAAWDAHGDHAHAFSALVGERTWTASNGAVVPYAVTPRAWVAVGTPIAPPTDLPAAVEEFKTAAAAEGRIALWFAVENPQRIPAARALAVGALPEWSLAGWMQVLGRYRRLREQLRRARAKGVTIREVRLDALSPSDAAAVSRLEAAWARTRRMEPMAFVVAHHLSVHPERRRAWLADQRGRAVALVTATSIPARRAWLMEDVRRDGAPNGTSELLFDTVLRVVAAEGAEWVTPGIVPLRGVTQRGLSLLRWLARPLYDFDGLAFFRARLHPDRWRPVYLVHATQVSTIAALRELLRAFAGGSLVGFGLRSLLRRPPGIAWVLAAGLVPWTLGITAMAVLNAVPMLGYSRAELWGWAAFDAALVLLLWATARARRLSLFALSTGAAAADAALSLQHLAASGWGAGVSQTLLRALAAGAPLLATGLLGYAWWREWRARRRVDSSR